MTLRLPLLRVAGAAAVALSLAACASDRERAAQQFREEPVADLYNRGAQLLDQRRWAEASTAFEEVERQHPYSQWARRAVLMTAYAKYQSNQYDAAVEAAQRFITLHPGNESAPDAYYLVAVCHFEQILDVVRDQATTQAALSALQEVVRRYPKGSNVDVYVNPQDPSIAVLERDGSAATLIVGVGLLFALVGVFGLIFTLS